MQYDVFISFKNLDAKVAQPALGYCYSNGEGVEQDSLKAEKWFSKAAEQGFVVPEKR